MWGSEHVGAVGGRATAVQNAISFTNLVRELIWKFQIEPFSQAADTIRVEEILNLGVRCELWSQPIFSHRSCITGQNCPEAGLDTIADDSSLLLLSRRVAVYRLP